MKKCSFTGHRTIEIRHRPGIRAQIDLMVRTAYEGGCRDFYFGGAIGFDTLAAECVLEFRETHPDVTVNLVLPCRNQSSRWISSDVERYEAILLRADNVECLSEHYYDGCMRARNQRLVDIADVLIAYAGRDGTGTAQTVRMAKKKDIPILNAYIYLDSLY